MCADRRRPRMRDATLVSLTVAGRGRVSGALDPGNVDIRTARRRRSYDRCMRVVIVAIVVASLGCASNRCAENAALPEGERVLAIGDSILAWSADRCESIPDVVARTLGERVVNHAVNGARVLGGSADRPAIPAQFAAARDVPWSAVIVDGGGNDLNGTCGCGDCAQVLDALVGADGKTGAMADLVDEMRASGARVVLVDYFALHRGAWYGF